MLRHGRAADRELVGELSNRERPTAEPFEDLAAGGIPERLQRLSLVSLHEP